MQTSSRMLSRAFKKAGISSSAKILFKKMVSQNLKNAYKVYYETKGSSKELRHTYTESLVEALAKDGNTTKEKVVQRIRQHEAQCSSTRKIKYLRGKINTGSTTMVTIQLLNGDQKDITNKQEIEKAIMETNQQKYQQSFYTPFYQSPL